MRKRWMSSLAQSEATRGRYSPGCQILARYIEAQWALPSSSAALQDVVQYPISDLRKEEEERLTLIIDDTRASKREAPRFGRGSSPWKTTFEV